MARAPIAEAVIDLRVRFESELEPQRFQELADRIKNDYPSASAIHTVEVRIGDPSQKDSVDRAELGRLARSADGKTLVQYRINGFTYNRLEPYPGWEVIYPEARRLWIHYSEYAKPTAITRFATRFINRLSLPGPSTNLHRYLTAPPSVPTGLPHALQASFTRIVISDSTREVSAIVTQNLGLNLQNPQVMDVILDIDAFKEVELKPLDMVAFDDVFAKLRALKNEIFFNSITQGASELFE